MGSAGTRLAGGGNHLSHLSRVDRGGVQGVGLAALLNALCADLTQAQQLPARQEESKGQEGEERSSQECDDRQQVHLLDLPRQRERQVTGATRGGSDSRPPAGNVFEIEGDTTRAALLLEPHGRLRQLIGQLR